MPEWSIGPHSKCGERATVPGVRIPLSPQKANEAKRCRAFDTFRFSVVSLQIYLHKILRETKRLMYQLFAQCFLQGPPRQAEGKGVTEQAHSLRSSQSLSLRKKQTKQKGVEIRHLSFFVASLQIYLHKMLRKTGRSTEKKQQRPQPLLFHAYATQRY